MLNRNSWLHENTICWYLIIISALLRREFQGPWSLFLPHTPFILQGKKSDVHWFDIHPLYVEYCPGTQALALGMVPYLSHLTGFSPSQLSLAHKGRSEKIGRHGSYLCVECCCWALDQCRLTQQLSQNLSCFHILSHASSPVHQQETLWSLTDPPCCDFYQVPREKCLCKETLISIKGRPGNVENVALNKTLAPHKVTDDLLSPFLPFASSPTWPGGHLLLFLLLSTEPYFCILYIWLNYIPVPQFPTLNIKCSRTRLTKISCERDS